MKHFGLLKDGTYKEFDSDKKALKYVKELKYLLVDIGTNLKGPVYSIVKAKDIIINNTKLVVELNVSYAAIDCPCCDETTITSIIPIESLSTQFCIYPLMKELDYFNIFKEYHYLTEDCISIMAIHVRNSHLNITIDPEEDNVKDIKNILRNNYLYTNGNVIPNKQCVVLKDGNWEITDIIPKRFDYIFPKISDQTFYRISNIQFNRLYSIEYLKINATELTEDSENDEFEYSPNDTLESTQIRDILEIALFYPQSISLQKKVYFSKVCLEIFLNTKFKNYHLTISDKEYGNGICLFQIIDKLLQM